MTGEEALHSYGYVVTKEGRYEQPLRRTQVWQKVTEGGWLRFEADGSACPFQVDPRANAVSLHIDEPSHAQYFDWVWPDEEIVRIYTPALPTEKRRGWKTLWLVPK